MATARQLPWNNHAEWVRFRKADQVEQLLRQFAQRTAREKYDVPQLRIINQTAKAILVASKGAR